VRRAIFTTRISAKSRIRARKKRRGRFLRVRSENTMVVWGGDRGIKSNEGGER